MGSKTVFVDGTIYNLAGALEGRPNLLRSTVLQSVLGSGLKVNLKNSVADSLRDVSLNGPAMKQRQLFRWAVKNNYPGNLSGDLNNTQQVLDKSVLIPYLPAAPSGRVLEVRGAIVDTADETYWAQAWISVNQPTRYKTNWTAEYLKATNQIRITWADATTTVIGVSPSLVLGQKYVICYYAHVTSPFNGGITDYVYIYRIGTGIPALDALKTADVSYNEFLPIIPVRIDNKSVRHADYAALLPDLKKCYRKATGHELDQIIDKVEDNPNLGDIDYAYVVHGVEVTTEENVGKRYIYEFLRKLIPYQASSISGLNVVFNDMQTNYTMNKADSDFWASNQPPGGPTDFDFLTWQATRPPGYYRAAPPVSQLRIRSGNVGFQAQFNFDVRLKWMAIGETIGSGLGKAGAKVGDLWWQSISDYTSYEMNYGGFDFADIKHHPAVRLYWQDQAGSYRYLTIVGLTFENYIYDGKFVSTTIKEAMDEGDDSGFFIPLHYNTLRELPLLEANQFAVSNRLIVFNCYKVKKTKWYQTGIFRILAVVVIAVIGAVFAPGAIGILGANLSIGAAMGFTGISAAIAGAVVNALAAMIIATVIEKGSIALFGEKLGAIIATVASLFAAQYVMNFQLTGSWTVNWSEMFKIDNLLKLTDAVSGAFTKMANSMITDINEELTELGSSYKDEMDSIEKLTLELLGSGANVLDPLKLTEVDTFAPRAESSVSFLSRTLATGSDLAQASLDVVSDFTDLSLQLPKPIA